jgi:hypothetical protein
VNGRARQKRNKGEGADGDQRGAFPNGAGQADDDAGQNAARGIGQNVMADQLPFGGAHGEGRFSDQLGMVRMASRVAMMTMGNIRSARVSPAVKTLIPK